MDYNKDKKCDICGKRFTKKSWEDHHDFHYLNCSNFIVYDESTDDDDIPDEDTPGNKWYCECDLVAHAGCCPQCHPSKIAIEIRELEKTLKHE
jgi:hypothetical protein